MSLKLCAKVVSVSLTLLLASCSNFSTPSRTPQSVDRSPDFVHEGGDEVVLENCGGKNGTARLFRQNGSLYLQLRGINRNYCSRWVTSRTNYNDVNIFNDDGNEVDLKIPIDESNPGERTILIASQSFIDGFKKGMSYSRLINENKKGDMIKFVIKPQAKDTTTDYIKEGGLPAVLENCGGKDGRATLRRLDGKLYLYVSGVECAYWGTSRNNFAEVYHIEDYNGDHSREQRIFIDESITGYRTIIIGSKKYFDSMKVGRTTNGRSGDVIKFYIKPRTINLDLTKYASSVTARLPNCGGSVEAKIMHEKLNIVFRDVRECRHFRFVTANNDRIGDDSPLQRQGANYGGSFTVSKKYVQYGLNNFTVSVYRMDGTEDIIKLQAVGFNWLDALIDLID